MTLPEEHQKGTRLTASLSRCDEKLLLPLFDEVMVNVISGNRGIEEEAGCVILVSGVLSNAVVYPIHRNLSPTRTIQ